MGYTIFFFQESISLGSFLLHTGLYLGLENLEQYTQLFIPQNLDIGIKRHGIG